MWLATGVVRGLSRHVGCRMSPKHGGFVVNQVPGSIYTFWAVAAAAAAAAAVRAATHKATTPFFSSEQALMLHSVSQEILINEWLPLNEFWPVVS